MNCPRVQPSLFKIPDTRPSSWLRFRVSWLAALFVLGCILPHADLAAETKRVQSPPKPWVKLTGCKYVPSDYNDGDSFHARYGTNEFIFRLYFVDAPETDNSFPKRNQEQSQHFGVTLKENGRAAQDAKAFSQEMLRKPFVVWTRWHNAMGRSYLPRHFALVEVNGKSLAEMLVSRGLARAKGSPANMPNGERAKSYMEKLKTLEKEARDKKVGIWKHSGSEKPN